MTVAYFIPFYEVLQLALEIKNYPLQTGKQLYNVRYITYVM